MNTRKHRPLNTTGPWHKRTQQLLQEQEVSGPPKAALERGTGHEATRLDKQLLVAPGRGCVVLSKNITPSKLTKLHRKVPHSTLYWQYKLDLIGGEKEAD